MDCLHDGRRLPMDELEKCPGCDGYGGEMCGNCNELGCDDCAWSGMIVCPDCNGTGYQQPEENEIPY